MTTTPVLPEPTLEMAMLAVNIQIIEQLMAENAQLREQNTSLDAECARLEAAIAVAQAAQPLSDEQLEREWTALQARRLKHANEALQTQVGQPCPQCKTGKLHIDSNGYNDFMRCQSCRHVPFQWPLQAAITAKTGDSMTDKTSEAFEAWFPFAFDPEFDSMAWKAWQAATLAERERCALVCDSVNNFDNPMTATDCADAIRQGGEA